MLKYRLTSKTLKDKNGNVKGKQNRIVVESALDLTPQEQAVLDSYVRNGYKMIVSQKGAKKTTGKGMTAEKILQYFYNTNNTKGAEAVKKSVADSENYMSMCKWLKKEYKIEGDIKKEVCEIKPETTTTKEIKEIKEKRNATEEQTENANQ